MDIQKLTTDQVVSVYSGKNGKCCCGCSGKHSYNPIHRNKGTKRRGYKVEETECNLKNVSRILNIIKKADLAVSINNRNDRTKESNDRFISTVVDNRLYIAYLV